MPRRSVPDGWVHPVTRSQRKAAVEQCGISHKRCKVAGGRGDNGHTTARQISHERRKAIELALQPVILQEVEEVESVSLGERPAAVSLTSFPDVAQSFELA